MNKEDFIQPKFIGARFENHTLPLSVAQDLAAYEELVVALAKSLYLAKHCERQRVPKGFTDGFHLHLEKVDSGSAVACLSVVAGNLLVNPLPEEFAEARALINEVISTEVSEKLPPQFPKELYTYFNRIGRSLEPEDSIEWTLKDDTTPSVLTPSKRKRLVLAVGKTYEAEVNLVGKVCNLDSDKNTGILRTTDNKPIDFVFDPTFFKDLKSALGDITLDANIQGVGEFDVNDRLKTIKQIEQLEIISHYPLSSAIDELKSLQDGWLEGHGTAPSPEYLSSLTNELVEVFPSDLEYPAVVPTEEGYLSLEWIRPTTRIELEIPQKGQLELYATIGSDDQFIEEGFDREDWLGAFTKIKTLLEA